MNVAKPKAADNQSVAHVAGRASFEIKVVCLGPVLTQAFGDASYEWEQLMRIRVANRSVLRGAVFLLALVGIVWAVAFRDPVTHAVPAGAQHIPSRAHDPPDNATNDPSANNVVSVPFMTHGYCFAGSKLKDTKAPGGFFQSRNAPQNARNRTNAHTLFLLAQPGVVMPFDGRPGMRVSLVNNTQDLLAFAASDSRLAITQEAQDTDGNWKPIEYLPSSDCGNSCHRVFLGPDQFWAFAAPRYKGSIPTKLRFAMVLEDGCQLHSNVFDGSVNPGQFAVEDRRAAATLMDAYDE